MDITKAKALIKHHFAIIFTLGLFLLSVIYVAPWGEHAVNDDWDFYLHVRYFMDGYFAKNVMIDSMFIVQGLIGTAWSSVFGLSLLNLRILTILTTLVFIFGSYKLLNLLEVNKKVVTLTLVTLIFNPLFYTSALSFMTEIYFITFTVWSMYFFIKYIDDQKLTMLIAAAVLGALGLLIRQFGFVTLIAYLIAIGFVYLKTRKLPLTEIFVVLITFGAAYLLAVNFPQYGDKSLGTTVNVNPEIIINQIKLYPHILSYIGFFLAPLLFVFLKKVPLKLKITLLAAGVLSYYRIYTKDIFPLGNVFYVEGLYSKANFVHDINLFDNIPFKLFLSIYVSFLILVFIYFVAELLFSEWKFSERKSLFKNLRLNLLVLMSLGMFGIVIASGIIVGDFFERYFFNFFIMAIITCAYILRNFEVTKLSIIAAALLIFITVVLAKDYYTQQEYSWSLGREVQKEQNIRNDIYVNGAFSRYMHSTSFEHPSQVKSALPSGLTYKCIISPYTETVDSNILLEKFMFFEDTWYIRPFIRNPEIYESYTTAGVESVEFNMDSVYRTEEYASPLYSSVGKKNILAVWCKD